MNRSTIYGRDDITHWLYRRKLDELRAFADVNRYDQVAMRRLQQAAETAFPLRAINGKLHRMRLYAWPFIVSLGSTRMELPGNLRGYFQSHGNEVGKRLTQCWAQMFAGKSQAQIYAMPTPVHAHAVYGVSPTVVHQTAQSTAKAFDTARPLPDALHRVCPVQAFASGGAQCVPVLLVGAVFVPDFGAPHPTAIWTPGAMRTAQDIVAGALSTQGQAKIPPSSVQALCPQPFFEAIESTVRADLLHALDWTNRDVDRRMRMECMYDGDAGEDVFSRELSFGVDGARMTRVASLAFDTTWLWSGAIESICSEAVEEGATLRQRPVKSGAPKWFDPNARP